MTWKLKTQDVKKRNSQCFVNPTKFRKGKKENIEKEELTENMKLNGRKTKHSIVTVHL